MKAIVELFKLRVETKNGNELRTERIGKVEAPDRRLNGVVLFLSLNLVGFGYGIAHEIWEEEAEMLEIYYNASVTTTVRA